MAGIAPPSLLTQLGWGTGEKERETQEMTVRDWRQHYAFIGHRGRRLIWF